MKKLDLRGLSCPVPLLKTREALATEVAIEVVVDDGAAKENILRYAQSQQARSAVQEIDGEYWITIQR